MSLATMRKEHLKELATTLKAVLDVYAQHGADCASRRTMGDCDCGFSVALRAVSDQWEGNCAGAKLPARPAHPKPVQERFP